jgi:hypothetical protein
MARVTIILGSSQFDVSNEVLQHESTLFAAEPNLTIYHVQTQVRPELLQDFLRALQEGSELLINAENMTELRALSVEFGAGRLLEECDLYRNQLMPAPLHWAAEAAAEAGPPFVPADQLFLVWGTWFRVGVAVLVTGLGLGLLFNRERRPAVVAWAKAFFGSSSNEENEEPNEDGNQENLGQRPRLTSF